MNNFEIWTLFISGLAIMIAVVSLIYSNKSNKRSINMQEMQTRPWLTACVIKNEVTKRYYDIVESDGYIDWKFEIEIENRGSTPANNIKLPRIANIKDITTVNENVFFEIDNIILGQGQKYRYTMSIGGKPMKPIEKDLLLETYKKNDKGLIFKFIVKYNGLLKPDKIYSTKATFDIKSDKVSIRDNSSFE